MRRAASQIVVAFALAFGVMTWQAAGRSDDTGAAAPVISAEGADALARSLTEGRGGVSAPGMATFIPQLQGEFRVVPAGDHYDVTIPAMRIASPEGSEFELNGLTPAFTPAADGTMAVRWNTPLSAWWHRRDLGRFNIMASTSSLTGTWVPAGGLFANYDLALGAITAVAPDDRWRLTIESGESRSQMAQDPSGTWSGDGTITLTDIAANDSGGGPMFGLGGATMRFNLSGFDAARVREMRSKLQTLVPATGDPNGDAVPGQAAKPGANERAGSTPSAQQITALAAFIGSMQGLMRGFSEEVQLHDLAIHQPDSQGPKAGTITIDKVGYTFRADNFDQDRGTVGIGYSHSGLNVSPSPGRLAELLLPQAIAIDLSGTGLPNGALLSIMTDIIKASARPQSPAGDAAVLQLVDALQQAGSELHVNTLRIVTPAAAGDLTATVTGDAQAAYGVTGSAHLQTRGLDALLAALSPAGGRAQADPARALIARLEALGRPGQDADGQQTMSYALDLTADGKVTLNGTDLSILLPPPKPPGGRATP